MSYYDRLDMDKFLNAQVVVSLHDGRQYVGKVIDGLINEDWEEDGESEALSLDVVGVKNLVGVRLKDISMIAKVSYIAYGHKEAV